MPASAMIALSAAALGIAATGMLSTLRGIGAPVAPRHLLAVYLLIAGLVAIPLVATFSPRLFAVYMPAALPMLLALPPTLLMYSAALTGTGRVAARRHAILPLAALLITMGYWTLPAAARETLFVHGELPPGRLPAILATATFGLIMVSTLGSLVYLIGIQKRLSAFRTRLKDQYSNVDAREQRWIDWLMVAFAIIWISVAVSLVNDNAGSALWLAHEWIMAATGCFLLFLFAAAPIKASPRDGSAEAEPEAVHEAAAEKYARSALTEDHAERLASRMEAAMRDHALFLDPNLSLLKLSRQVGAAPNLVSQTLNERLGMTFFDYVGSWRVSAAKPLLLADEQPILTIAMEVGFNSKSTFYKAFGKATGMTPTDWRKAHTVSG